MSTLVNLQNAFQNHLLYEDVTIKHQLTGPVDGLLAERLAIYENSYRWRLRDGLYKEYGLLHTYLGDERFVELCEAYIDAFPSRFYSISDFTKQLPSFLLTYETEKPYLNELADLIKALSLSLEAKDAFLLNVNSLMKVPMQNWPSLCFKYHPSVKFLTFQWNTFALWKALVQKKMFPLMQKEDSYCIVWRKELQSYANILTKPETIVFQNLQLGFCFSDACEALYLNGLSNEAEAATLVASCLTRWLNDHLFSEVYIP